MVTFRYNDTDHGPEQIREQRAALIELRDEMLKAGAMDWAVVISLNIAALYEMAKHIWGEEWIKCVQKK